MTLMRGNHLLMIPSTSLSSVTLYSIRKLPFSSVDNFCVVRYFFCLKYLMIEASASNTTANREFLKRGVYFAKGVCISLMKSSISG